MDERIRRALTAAGAALLVVACGDKGTEPPPPLGPGDVAAIAVSPPTATLESFGESVQLTATATASDGRTITNAGLSWSSDDDAKASVSTTGQVTAHADGTVTISASGNGVSSDATVTVAQVAALLTFADAPEDTEVDGTLPPIRVEAHDALGSLAEGFAADVTLELDANPGSATLSGTTTAAAVAGIATFDDLALDAPGSGFTLRATATGLTESTSSDFAITEVPESVAWTGPSGGTWSDGANWSTGAPPASVDRVTIDADGTYAVVIDVDVTIGDLTVGGGTGLQTVVVDGVSLTVTGSAAIAASGNVSVEGGALTVADLEVAGILSAVGGATRTVTGAFEVTATGSIRGVGALDLTAATSQQIHGTIAPGLSPGQLDVAGDLVLGDGSTIQLEIEGLEPGTQYDRLVVSGAVTLSGTLNVTLGGGFTLPPGVTLPMLQWGVLTGGSVATELPPSMTASVGPTGVDVEAIAPPPAAWEFAAADGFTCGIRNGESFCWGPGTYGRLGNGLATDQLVPTPVSGDHDFVKIDPGADHACALDTAGQAFCWGRNTFGQVGDGSTTDRLTPVPVSGGHTFVDVEAGIFHSCGLRDDGLTLCWGNDGLGQFGDGRAGNEALLNLVPIVSALGMVFESLTVGTQHTCWLDADGDGFCAGSNSDGQLGAASGAPLIAQPTPISGNPEFVELSAGRLSTCGLTAEGDALCWGDNTNGGLGDGTTTASGAPVAVIGGHAFTTISNGEAGWAYACGLDAGGAAWCWGGDWTGGLGNGEPTHTSEPTLVLGGHTFRTIDAGTGQTCGLTDVGGLLCWGSGNRNGDGTGENKKVPTPVVDPS